MSTSGYSLRPPLGLRPQNAALAGYGLIELLITLVIASVVLGLAMPGFNKLVSNTRLTAYTNDFIAALMLAKSEAVRRNAVVSVLSASGTPGQWEDGWYVYLNANPTLNGGVGTFSLTNASLCLPNSDCLIRVHDPLPSGYTLRTVTGGTSYDLVVSYAGTGLSQPWPNPVPPPAVIVTETFTLCDSTHDNTQSRQIAISAIGRAQVSVSTGNCP